MTDDIQYAVARCLGAVSFAVFTNFRSARTVSARRVSTLGGLIYLVLSLLLLFPVAPLPACDESPYSTAGETHNVAKYVYNWASGLWEVDETWHDPNVDSFQVSSSDKVYHFNDGQGWVILTQSTPPSGSTPPGGGGTPPPPPGDTQPLGESSRLKPPLSRDNLVSGCDDPWDGGVVEVTGSTIHGGPVGWRSTPSVGFAMGGGGGGGAPPLPPSDYPENCNTGHPQIDENEDLLKDLWDSSDPDESVSFEQAGLLWPQPDGGYEMLEYGVDIPGGGMGTCAFTSPPSSSFPPPSEWPEGVVHVHVHPYNQFTYPDSCPRGYSYGPSAGDRGHLAALRNMSGRDDIQGIVIDADMIFIYGVKRGDDEAPNGRCGY